ncbi:LuxR C-terminal-related transcriptional regulator [Ktedonospora formicarum]|uniref:LuxR family transcriptional regulator n=1 Tax=Ktedonospora formicarum TaxID=2778364 RepID=A0A8J3HQT0_9CHLR|nr:LuxR C-terminal-related transcriptional regulator [Ktedonospora formicarum]GHO41879.1 LuxR family transcriptional regulator [Ktedonospora formicarum]
MAGGPLPLLRWSSQEQCYTITLGSLILSPEITHANSAWKEWLNGITSFAFENQSGVHCTIRKERLQRGDTYWYAYRSIEGRTKKRYLGRTADLSFERLEKISSLFSADQRKASRSVSTTLQRANHVTPNHEIALVPAPLLSTKLHPPQLPALLIERSRLLTRLNNSLMHKLSLLQAPAGFGKTTLVNQWLTTVPSPPAFPVASWISLDAGDNDPFRFWRSVITACQRLLGPEQGQTALSLLAADTSFLFDRPPLEIALTHLLNLLAEPSCGGLLILDDYHVITEPSLHKTLAFFIDHLPKTVHVVLLSRAEPDLPLLRWRARGELYEMHGADLRFSSEETAVFLQRALPIALSEAAFKELDTSLQGWAAGLRLLCLTLSRWQTSQAVEQMHLLSGDQRDDFSSLHRSLFDYFATEILEAQEDTVQRFLLQTSVLSCLCGPLCDAVTGCEGSSTQLKTIERAGLFLETLEGPGEWYRYHPLFAKAMRREASRHLGEEALRAGSLRASIWYEQEALLAEAIEAAWQARDVERMAKLIEQLNAQRDFNEPYTMRRWLEHLPDVVLQHHPMLCLLLAIELRYPVELRFAQTGSTVSEAALLSLVERSRIQTLLQMAEEGWQNQGIRSWIGAIWAFRVLSDMLDQKPFSSLVTSAQQALVFLPLKKALDHPLLMWRATCLLIVGIEKLHMGQVSESRQLLLQAQKDSVSPGNTHLTVAICSTLGKIHLIQGQLSQAKQYHSQVLSHARKLFDDVQAADALLELAWLAYEWNDLTGAEQQAREALELAQQVRPQRTELVARAELQFALLEYARNEPALALQRVTTLLADPEIGGQFGSPCSDYELKRTWTPESFWLLSRLHDWQGRLRIATGDLLTVQERLDFQAQNSECFSFTEQLGEQVRWGRLWLAQGKGKAALEQFARLLPLAKAHLHQYAALEIQLLLAQAYAACKQEQQARQQVVEVLSQAQREGFLRLFLNEGKPLVRLLRSLLPAIQGQVLRLYVQTILRTEAPTHGLEHPSHTVFSTSGPASFVEPLSLQEQRVLRLLGAGLRNTDIAQELVISVNTVKTHVQNIYRKLGVRNRFEAGELARRLSLPSSS